jgi:hypothetical protein
LKHDESRIHAAALERSTFLYAIPAMFTGACVTRSGVFTNCPELGTNPTHRRHTAACSVEADAKSAPLWEGGG